MKEKSLNYELKLDLEELGRALNKVTEEKELINNTSEVAIWVVSNLISDRIPSKAKPWISPKQKESQG